MESESGRPLSVSERILRRAEAAGEGARPDDDRPGGSLDHELQQQQLETDTAPHTRMEDLGADVRAWRDTAIMHAREAGARVVASGTSPVPVEPRLVHDARFERMAEQFGLTTYEQLACGCHVHVSVDSPEEGVGVLDRIRVWLPTLLAISANSPFSQGVDTGYASFRSQLMGRWPTTGPQDVFGSASRYRELVAATLATEVVLDEGMLYFDARLSHRYPTVEIRVADVCLDAGDTVLVAALCRALVDTAAAALVTGEPPLSAPTSLLRLAGWRAGREGVGGRLLDPRTALRATGDETLVERRLEHVLARGNGAVRQRAVLERTGRLGDVVADLARVTAGQDG